MRFLRALSGARVIVCLAYKGVPRVAAMRIPACVARGPRNKDSMDRGLQSCSKVVKVLRCLSSACEIRLHPEGARRLAANIHVSYVKCLRHLRMLPMTNGSQRLAVIKAFPCTY